MEINEEKISFNDDVTYTIKSYKQSNFIYPRHYHPEYELTYIKEGQGKLYTGNTIIDFQGGDLFLIAPCIIHSFRNPRNYSGYKVKTKAHSVYFRPDFLGNDFLNRQEAIKLNEFFKRAGSCILQFRVGREVINLLKRIIQAESLSGIAILLEIMNKLSLDKNVLTYSNELVLNKYYVRYSRDKRIEKISDYLLKHLEKKITSREVAAMVDMSAASFSRFFKHRTKKTFTRVVNEIRLVKAQKLLLESDKRIHEICRECGYANLSYFNRQFKRVNRMSPGEFRGIVGDW